LWAANFVAERLNHSLTRTTSWKISIFTYIFQNPSLYSFYHPRNLFEVAPKNLLDVAPYPISLTQTTSWKISIFTYIFQNPSLYSIYDLIHSCIILYFISLLRSLFVQIPQCHLSLVFGPDHYIILFNCSWFTHNDEMLFCCIVPHLASFLASHSYKFIFVTPCWSLWHCRNHIYKMNSTSPSRCPLLQIYLIR